MLTGLALLAIGGLWYALTTDRDLRHLQTATVVAADAVRRAHVRLDNQQLQIEALAKELGWTDDRSFTKVLTARLPGPPKER